MSASTLQSVAANVDERTVGNERVIDFDIDANTDYEIQSCVMVDDDDRVVEAAVRFGRVEERPELGIGASILSSAWSRVTMEEIGDMPAIEADMSDFQHTVPHLRVNRENVEEFGCETLSLDAFADLVATLAEFVSGVLRADDATIDAEIDNYL
ncbi:hypothetical protein [Halosegnis rubeus]|uniref:Uncharacterized protein n=1 Tax=Halosegnis rubeus TaxID=2212850 RepID=A0A5N5UJB0_9EURY|nr:hypothetical protein [Halosegnis rubeus]KAB7518808.1 hypothetical protein DP108_06475 [Halosegnis rubeus]